MYDGGKIIVGLIIGVVLLLIPFWPIGDKWAAKMPEPDLKTPKIMALDEEDRKCVEPRSYIRTEHMKLLDEWRNEAIRDGNRVYRSSTGKIYDKSLQNTCMECHSNKSKFCDACHNYSNVDPYCWECHIEPKEKK